RCPRAVKSMAWLRVAVHMAVVAAATAQWIALAGTLLHAPGLLGSDAAIALVVLRATAAPPGTPLPASPPTWQTPPMLHVTQRPTDLFPQPPMREFPAKI
ncbi:hypothetical protein Vafri_3952, partial [Volvox africanus]